MPNLFRYILPFLILLTSLKGEAQVYPVQSTLQITPPYSLTLADYVAPGSEKLALNIFLADVNRPELSVRLRLRIEGVGIRIETKAEYLPEPMMISGGVPLRLIGADLVDYFDPRNLNFSGITQREYEQKAALPEGLYQFTFEVIEYNRGVKISNSATVMAWLILNDPPLINLPGDNDKIRIQSPQQVIFQWTPRHTGSPNAAFSTEYEFRLVEVWPSTRNPNDAILTSPAIFETTTAASTLIYGPAETPLEPGRRYAFRIKAKSIVGVDELNLFKNNGYSQVSTFVYGDACTLPTGIQAEVISSSKIGFAWDTQDNHTGYNIKYRLANTPNAAWYTNTSALNDIEINSLQPATTYEYQVAAACGSYESEYSPVATVTTNEAQAITYSCGLPLNPFDLDPSQLIESLKTGDVIQAGDFDVKLTEVSGSNGIFTGKGVIEVPFFNKARLQASFSSISVNKELRMVAGSMNITGGGVEVIPAGVMDLMDELTEALALADSALNLVESNLPQPFDPYSFVADKEVKIPGTITSVTKGANGGVVVTASNGTEQTIPAGGTTAITDSNGNGYLIDSKGNIHPTTAAIASAAARREYNLNVNFAKASDTRFGFDAKKHDALLTTYEHVKDTYYASWKSIATGQTDNALALLEGTNVDKTKIHFEQSGVGLGTSDLGNISQSPSPNSQVLAIKGTTDGMQESVVALYTPSDTTKKEQVLGKLNVITYNQIDKHVVIVPVNGNTFDKFGTVAILQDSLNKIYNQGIVNWTVELKAGITVEGISPFEDGGTGLLSNFTSHMKKVINAYKENTTPDTYYLFLVSNPQDPSTLGVMPRSKEYGFIFADKHSTLPEVARTIAHELGHGAFNLHHTFMEPNYTITKGTTDNLMDYPAGPKLYKYQWDKIRYPDIVVGIFESDEESKDISTNDIPISLINSDTATFNFITPSGKKITLPKGAVSTFRYGIVDQYSHDKPIGYLNSFKIRENGKEVKYIQARSASGANFVGYVSESGKLYEDAYTSKNNDSNIILMVPGAKGYTYIKYKIRLDPYQNGEKFLTYLDFPIQPYSQGLDVIKSEFRAYSTLGGLIANENEQWTLDVETLEDMLSEFDGKPEHSYVLKIIELRTAYPKLFEIFTSCWDKWELYQCDKLWGYWESDVLSKKTELRSKWKNDPVTYYKTFAEEFITFIWVYRAIGTEFFKEDVVTKWKESTNKVGFRRDLLIALTMLSNENVSSLVSCENRVGSIAILTEGSVVEPFEQEIVRLLRYVPDSQVTCTLDSLVKKSPTGEGKLLYRLMNDVHDQHLWMGENNFKELNKAIAALALRYPKYQSQYDVSVINGKNTISFYDATFWARVKQGIAAEFSYYYPLTESKVTFGEDCSVKLENLSVQQGVNTGGLASGSGVWADPYTLVLVTNNSHLDMLTDIAGYSRGVVMPVLMLEYMDWKGSEKFTVDGLNAMLDVVSTASGVGAVSQLRHLTKLQKAARIFDLTSSVAGISSGLFEEQIEESPTLKAAINLIQIASAVTNLTEAFKNAGKVSDLTKVVDDLDQVDQLGNVTRSLDEIEKQAATLKSITSRSQAGYAQKVQIYAFLKKLKADALSVSPVNQKIVNQITRIENQSESVDQFILSVLRLSEDQLAALRQVLKKKGLTNVDLLDAVVINKIKDWDATILAKLDGDIPSIKAALNENPELIAIWQKAKDANIDEALRRNPKLLRLAATLDCKL